MRKWCDVVLMHRDRHRHFGKNVVDGPMSPILNIMQTGTHM